MSRYRKVYILKYNVGYMVSKSRKTVSAKKKSASKKKAAPKKTSSKKSASKKRVTPKKTSSKKSVSKKKAVPKKVIKKKRNKNVTIKVTPKKTSRQKARAKVQRKSVPKKVSKKTIFVRFMLSLIIFIPLSLLLASNILILNNTILVTPKVYASFHLTMITTSMIGMLIYRLYR